MLDTTPPAFDVQALIDRQALGRFQHLVLLAGFCLIALDGFDLTCMGFIAPALKAQWQLSNLALGPVLSAALIGLALGAMAAGPIADRIGRKAVILGSLLLLGGFTLAAASAQNITQLTALRFAAGLGMGALMPNAATLAAEFVPRRRRSLAVSLVYCGLPVSAACGGFLSAWLIPNFGWQSVLAVGGALPLLLLPAFAWKLPESPGFLVSRGAAGARVRAVMNRIAPGLGDASATLVAPMPLTASAAGPGLVLSRRYLLGGAMLWIAYFASLFTFYLLANWLPTLIKESGFNLATASTVTGLFQSGGLFGTLALGWGMDRIGAHKLLASFYGMGALILVGMSHATHELPVLAGEAFLLGCCVMGATGAMNALAAAYYPSEARATGVSWMHGAGRWGAILSAFAGAQMLALGWHADTVFLALTFPVLCAAGAVLVQSRSGSS